MLFSFSSEHADFADSTHEGNEIYLSILKHAFSFQGGEFL